MIDVIESFAGSSYEHANIGLELKPCFSGKNIYEFNPHPIQSLLQGKEQSHADRTVFMPSSTQGIDVQSLLTGAGYLMFTDAKVLPAEMI